MCIVGEVSVFRLTFFPPLYSAGQWLLVFPPTNSCCSFGKSNEPGWCDAVQPHRLLQPHHGEWVWGNFLDGNWIQSRPIKASCLVLASSRFGEWGTVRGKGNERKGGKMERGREGERRRYSLEFRFMRVQLSGPNLLFKYHDAED